MKNERAYWVNNKHMDEMIICGSLPAVVEVTGMTYRKLRYIFSEKKLDRYQDDMYEVRRLNVVRSSGWVDL